MGLTELKELLLSSDIPPEIRNDKQRLSDFVKGAECMYNILQKYFGDDLR